MYLINVSRDNATTYTMFVCLCGHTGAKGTRTDSGLTDARCAFTATERSRGTVRRARTVTLSHQRITDNMPNIIITAAYLIIL